jgi:phage shock protein PspC (stress-responsive transcriptional regulator)
MGFSSSLYGGLGLTNQIDIPYVKIILISILTVMIVYAMIAFIAYLISEKVFKSETSYKKMITWLGVTSTLLTAVVLVAAIFSLMSVKVGLVIYAAGAMLNTYYMYKGLSFACNTDENKLGYILMPAILVTAFVVGYILPKILF